MFLYVIAFVYQYVLCQLLSICTVTKTVKICRHTDASRARVLVVLAFSMIFFERNAFFAREGLGYIGARDMYIDLRFNLCIRYIILYKRDLTPIYMGVGKRCAHRRATRRDETPSADARAVREETRGAGGCRGRCGPRRRPRARSRRENSRIHSFIRRRSSATRSTMKCCARGRADGRSETSSDAGDASATMSESERFDGAERGIASDEEEARWDEGRGRDSEVGDEGDEGERSRRRSPWDRAGDEYDDDGGSASPTHSTFGRDSERRRRMRKTSKLVAERLGGAASDESDDDEFAGGLERARSAALDEEQGFGFITRGDVERRREERARAKREEEEERRRREEAKEAKRAKRERRRAAKKRERELVEESETASLLDGTAKPRVRRFIGLKVSTVKYAAVAVSAVVACGVGAVLYSGGSTKSGTMEIRSGEDTLKTADPTLQPLKATTDRILKGMKERVTGKKSSDAKETKSAGESVDADKDSLKTKKSSKGMKSKDDDEDDDGGEKKKKKKRSAADDDEEGADADDDIADAAAAAADDDDDDAKSSHDKKKKSQKKSRREASLGVVPMVAEDDSIKASSSCAPVHVKSRHGVFRQYNKACMGDEERPLGCDAKSSEGCQSCFIDGSAAATQVKSYARCSPTFATRTRRERMRSESERTRRRRGELFGHGKRSSGQPQTRPTVPRRQKMFANPASTPDARAETEVCLPNLEDAKRGIFQYSERYCRTLGHTDVDYSGCISVGKSSCRMCVTKSARSSSAAFSVCPRAVCEHHDLLYQQCLEDEEN